MRKLKQLEIIESDVLHSPFFPEDIRANDGLKAELLVQSKWHTCKVWRYSPFGVELVISDLPDIKKGSVFSIKLHFLEDEVLFDSIPVSVITNVDGKKIVGFRTFRQEDSGQVESDRRKSTRWACPPDLLPTGTASNPLKFNDYIIFRVEDISKGGLRVITSMRNKLLYQGQFLECSISLPLVGSVNVTLKIVFVSVITRDDKEYLVLGTSFIKPDNMVISCLAEYLLHFGRDVSSSSLKADGFPVKKELRTLDFSYVKSKWDYDQVLELRKAAYVKAGKVKADIDANEMADEYDSRARVLLVRNSGRTVGSVRVMFHQDFKDSELYKDGVREIPGVDLSQAVEASRLCTDSEMRGLDIAYQLVSHFTLTAIKSGKRYIFGGAAGSMIDFYEKAGWTICEESYTCSSLLGMPHKIVFVDIHQVVLGKGIPPKIWNRLYKDMFNYLYEREVISPSKLDLLRLKIYAML